MTAKKPSVDKETRKKRRVFKKTGRIVTGLYEQCQHGQREMGYMQDRLKILFDNIVAARKETGDEAPSETVTRNLEKAGVIVSEFSAEFAAMRQRFDALNSAVETVAEDILTANGDVCDLEKSEERSEEEPMTGSLEDFIADDEEEDENKEYTPENEESE